MSIVSLSSMLFMIPFENISVSSFSPDDRSGNRKYGGIWCGFIVEGDGSVGRSFVESSFISLLLCFSVPVLVSVKVFSFQVVVKFKHLFIKTKVTR